MAAKSAAALFLDTAPFNGHSTVAEALWEAIPVLTIPATRMAGRVAASLLTAVGLGGTLIARTPEEYTDFAAALLSSGGGPLLAARAKMAEGRGASRLWDTDGWVRGLESAARSMWEVHSMGGSPAHVVVL